MEMNKRERVEQAMALQETDRVPLYDLLRNDAAFAHFGGEPLPALATDPQTVRNLERIAGKAVGVFLDMTRSVGFGPVEQRDTTDDYGFVHRHSPYEKTSWIVHRPFADERGASDFLQEWTADRQAKTKEITANPLAHRERFHRHFLEIQGRIGDTVNLLTQHGVGLDSVRHLLGFELFAYVQVDQPGLISAALEAMTEHNIAECHAIADLELSPAVLTYSDIAYKQRLLHSPTYLRSEIFPRLKRLHDAWHEHGFKCLFHSDGYLMDVLDDLLDIGCDGLNPLKTVAGMDLRVVREKCGQQLFLAGGIDMSQLLANGTPEEVRAVCEQAIRDASPGYLMGSTTESDNSCALENLLVMYDVAMTSR